MNALTKPTHTPAPWIAVTQGPFIATPDNKVIAKVVCMSNEGNVLNCQTASPADYETIGNALLIAAAPELLEALEDAQQALAHALHRLKDDSSFSTSIALKGAEEKARHAINKAKGGN